MTISRCILLRMRNILDKCCRETQKAYFIFNIIFSENRAVYEIMSKNMVEAESLQMRRISRATRAHAHAHAHTTAHSHTHTQAVTCTHTRTRTELCNTYLLLFHGNNGIVNAPQCYVMCTLPVLFDHPFVCRSIHMTKPAQSLGFNIIIYIHVLNKIIEWIVLVLPVPSVSFVGPDILLSVLLSVTNSFYFTHSYSTHFFCWQCCHTSYRGPIYLLTRPSFILICF